MSENSEIQIQQGFNLRNKSLAEIDGGGKSALFDPEMVRKRNEYIHEHATTRIIYNVAMSKNILGYADEIVRELIRSAKRIELGEKNTDGLFQKRLSLLHLLADDTALIVDAWSDPVDTPNDMEFEEAFSKQAPLEMNIYKKFVDFWEKNTTAKVVGKIQFGAPY